MPKDAGQYDPSYLKKRLDDLELGRHRLSGQVTLASATQTTVSRPDTKSSGVSSNSHVNLMASSAQATQGDIIRISCAKDSFTIFHTSPGGATKTFTYQIFTGYKTANEP